MPALNYQKRFAGKVESGEKLQTIRVRRKYPIKPGDTLYHFTGQRTKCCRELLTSLCLRVSRIKIMESEIRIVGKFREKDLLSAEALDEFARKDGFQNYAEMWEFFKNHQGLLDLIEW